MLATGHPAHMTPAIGDALLAIASPPVLFVADRLKPIDVLSVHGFLDRDVRHRVRGRRAVPMPQAGWKPDDIARANFLDRAAFTLHPAETRRDDEGLAQRMRVPVRACARFKGDMGRRSRGSALWPETSDRPARYR
jgi:hypothetical protein